jgi:hypothetical protein
MTENDRDRLARENHDAVQRVHRQLYLDGKLDKALANEGWAYLVGPIVLLGIFGLAVVLGGLGLSDEGRAVVGTVVVIAAIFGWGCWQALRR